MRLHFLLGRVFPLLCLILLAGCGGGADEANDDDSDALIDAPLADDPQLETDVPVVDDPDVDSIENLFGQVTFTYRVAGSSNEARTSVTFAASGEGPLLLGGRTVRAVSNQQAFYECVEILFADEDFLCVRVAPIHNTSEVFFFQMDSQLVGSGAYEFCDGTPEACGNDVVVSPDGTVDVTISRNAVAASHTAYLNGMPTSNSELLDFMHADVLEFGDANTGGEVLPQTRVLEKTLHSMMHRLR